MNENSIAIGIGALALAGIAWLVLATAPADAPPASASMPSTLPSPLSTQPGGASNTSRAGSVPGAAPTAGPPVCSLARLDSWRLVSASPGAYRQAGFAVLYNERLGAVNVREAERFDGALLLKRVDERSVDLGCDTLLRTLRLDGTAVAPDAPPAMRTALPEPPAGAGGAP